MAKSKEDIMKALDEKYPSNRKKEEGIKENTLTKTITKAQERIRERGDIKETVKPKEQSSKVRENTLTKTVSMAQEQIKKNAKTNPYLLYPVEEAYGDTAATESQLTARDRALEDTDKKIKKAEEQLKSIAGVMQRGSLSPESYKEAYELYTKIYDEYTSNIDFYNKTADEADKLYNHYISRTAGSEKRANTYAYQIKELEEELKGLESVTSASGNSPLVSKITSGTSDIEKEKKKLEKEIAELKQKAKKEREYSYDYIMLTPGTKEIAEQNAKLTAYDYGNFSFSFGHKDYNEETELKHDYINDTGKARKMALGNEDIASIYKKYEFLTEEEKRVYNFLYNPENPSAAEQFLKDMEETLNWRWANDKYEDMPTVAKAMYWLPAGVEKFVNNGGQAIETYIRGNGEALPTSAMEYTSELVRQEAYKKSDLLGGLYTFGEAGAAMLPSMAANLLMPGVGYVMTGLSSAGGAYRDKINEGWLESDARLYGIMVGSSEALLSKFIGKLGNLGARGVVSNRVLNNVLTKIGKINNKPLQKVLSFGARLGIDSTKEGIEESLQAALEPAFVSLITGEDYKLESEDVITAYLMGSAMAAIYNAPGAFTETSRASKGEIANLTLDTSALDEYYGGAKVDYFADCKNFEEVKAEHKRLVKEYSDVLRETDKGRAQTDIEYAARETALSDINRQYKYQKAFYDGMETARENAGKSAEEVKREAESKVEKYAEELVKKEAAGEDLQGDMAVQSDANVPAGDDFSAEVARQFVGETKEIAIPVARQIEQWDRNGRKEGLFFDFGTPSQPLLEAKIPKDRIQMDSSKANKLMKEHPEITIEELKQLDKVLNDPVIVLKSKRTDAGDSYVIFGEIAGTNGKPIMVAIRTGLKGGINAIETVTKITSAYTRRNTQNFIDSSPVLWVTPNKERTAKWMYSFGLQLPSATSKSSSLSNNRIPQGKDIVNNNSMQENENYADVPIENDFSAEVMRQLAGGKVIKGDVENEQYGRNAEQVSEKQGREQGQAGTEEERSALHMREGGRLDNFGKRKRAGRISESVRRRGKSGEQRKVAQERSLETLDEEFRSPADLGITNGVSDASLRVYPRHAWDNEALAAEEWALRHGAREVTFVTGEIRVTKNGRVTKVDAVYEDGRLIARADSPRTSLSENVEHEMGHLFATPEKVTRFMQKVKASTKPAVWQRVFEVYKAEYAPLTGNYEGMSAEEIEIYVFEEIMGDAFADTKNFGQDPTVWGSFADEVLIPEEAAQAGIISADEEIRDRTEEGNLQRGPPAESEQRFAVRRSGNRRMYQFPPYNESYSEANELATRWAHREDVETGDKALVSYHDNWYVIEKFDSADLGYQIVEDLTESEYRFIKERKQEYEKEVASEGQPIRETFIEVDNLNRQRDTIKGRKSGANNLPVEQRKNDSEVQRVGKKQAGSGETAGNRNRNNERSIEDSGRQNVETPEPLSLPSLDDAPKDKQRYKIADEPEGLSLPSLDDKSKYDYDNLVKKPDMEVTLLENDVPKKENGEIDRKETALKGIENVRKKQNPKNTDERTFVYISDIEKDVLVTQDGLRHGLTRKPEVTAKATLNIGDILQNAIKINELKAKKSSTGGYALLGMGVDAEGNYYPTRIIVNNFSVDEVEVLDVIYAINAKRRTSPQKRQGVVGNPTPLIKGSSSISIADLLDIVKDYFPDILPESVLQHYGIYRPKSSLSDSVRYKVSGDSLLGMKDKERSEDINKLREKERRLRNQVEEQDERLFGGGATEDAGNDAYFEWQEAKEELEEELYGKRRGKEIPPEKMQIEGQDRAKQIIEERNKKENEAWDERKEHNSRETFKGTPALDKLGVKIENSATVYHLIPQRRANAEYLKMIKKDIDRLVQKNGMTDFEIRMAKQYADGDIEYDFLEARVLYEKEKAKRNGNSYRTPNLRMIEELADLYHLRKSLSEAEPARTRSRINEEIDEDMRKLVSKSEAYRDELLENQNKRYKENGQEIGKAQKAARNVGKFFWNQEMRYSSPARNMRNLFGDDVGEKLNRELSYPVAENESENTRFKQRQNDELRDVTDKNGKKRALTREESALAQRVLEGEPVRQSVKQNELKDAIIGAAKRLKAGDVPVDVFKEFNVLKSEEKELAHRYAYWLETDELMKSGEFDGVIIKNAAEIAKRKYDDFFEAINDFFVAHGFEPIGYIKGYAPHFQPDETKNGIEEVFKKLGFSEDAVALSTQLAGRTQDFKPYKRWNPHFLQRKGNYTEYDLVKGYERYVDYLGDILYHTDDVIRIRSLSRVLRTDFAPDNVRENVDRARAVLRGSTDEQIKFLKDVRAIEKDKEINASEARLLLEEYVEETVKNINLQGTKMNDVVVWLDNWANILAGKQALEDRSTEYTMGREALNSSSKINRAYARAMISGVVSSAVNQIAETPVIYAELGTRYTAAAIKDMTIGAVSNPEGWKSFIEKSDYLTRKHGVKALVKSGYEKFVDGTFAPLNWVDEKLVSTLALRGKYLQELGKGKSESEALKIADRWVANVMSDYSKGSKPLAFHTKNAFAQMINMFQQPILNSWQHIYRDLPHDIKEVARESGKKKAAKMLGAIILRLIPAAFLINRLADELYGATPAPFDPLGLVLTFMAGGERMTENEYFKKLYDECVGIITGTPVKDKEENRKREFDYENAIKAVIDAILEEIPFVRNITTVTGLSFSDYSKRSNSAIPGAQIVNDVASLVSSGKEAIRGKENIGTVGEDLLSLISKTVPLGNQGKKTVLGIMAYARGGVYNGYGEEKKLKFPVNDSLWSLFQLMLFGPYGTQESDEFYAKEHSALSVKQTELYNELSKAGADRESVYDGIQEFRSIDNNEELKTLQKHQYGNDIINAMNLTDEQKLEVYRVLHSADSRAEKFKAIMETGLSFEKVTEAYEKHVEYNVQEDKDSSQKAVQFASWVDRQNYSDKQKAKIKEEFMYWTQIPANADAYEKMVGNGLSPEEAERLALEMQEQEPAEGKESVSVTQKAAVIANSTDLSEKEKLLALEGYLTEEQYIKVAAVAEADVKVSAYYEFREILPDYDEDGNGNYKQKEVTKALKSMKGLSNKEKAALWQSVNSSWKGYKNPFDTNIGSKVYNSMKKAKKEEKDELALSLPSLDDKKEKTEVPEWISLPRL